LQYSIKKDKFVKTFFMALQVEDLENQTKYNLILKIPYSDLIQFVLDFIKKKSALIFIYWFLCLIFLSVAIIVRINISGNFPLNLILFHSAIGLVILPLLCIVPHEFLHIIPFYLSGAKNIRVGMDLKQYLFYVTAHRHVATPSQFRIVAFTPFVVLSSALIILIIFLPGLWKWSLSIFLFVHATMCAGDFALLNFYFLNRNKLIYTWDDADKKEAYFYEEIQAGLISD